MSENLNRQPLPMLTASPPYVKRGWFLSPVVVPTLNSDQDQDTLKELTAYTLRWCEQRNLIKTASSGIGYDPIISKNITSFRYQIYANNLRRMVVRDDLAAFLDIAADNDLEHLLTELQQLCIQLSVLYGSRIIDGLINRIYQSYHVIPTPSATMGWDDVHLEYPFFWVILFVHIIITFHTEPSKRLIDP